MLSGSKRVLNVAKIFHENLLIRSLHVAVAYSCIWHLCSFQALYWRMCTLSRLLGIIYCTLCALTGGALACIIFILVALLYQTVLLGRPRLLSAHFNALLAWEKSTWSWIKLTKQRLNKNTTSPAITVSGDEASVHTGISQTFRYFRVFVFLM